MTDEIDSDANNTHELTAEVARALIARGWRLTTAESCTGGNLAAALCARADTAAFYDTGVVTFSDEAKRNVLQVRAETRRYTAPSAKPAFRRCPLVFWRSPGPISPSPSAATPDRRAGKMVPRRHGMVCRNFRGQTETKRMCFAGDCETVVAKAVRYARRR